MYEIPADISNACLHLIFLNTKRLRKYKIPIKLGFQKDGGNKNSKKWTIMIIWQQRDMEFDYAYKWVIKTL